MGLAFICTPLSAKDVLSDSAIFSIHPQVYFKSDIGAMLSSLGRFQCVYKSSELFRNLKLTKTILASAQGGFYSQELLQKLILLEKMRRDVAEQFQIDYQELWNEISPRGCLKNGPSGWSANLKNFFLLEYFFNQQFASLPEAQRAGAKTKFMDAAASKYRDHLYKYDDKISR